MAWTQFWSLSCILGNLASAAYLQYPLQSDSSGPWDKLNSEVGNLISYAYPVARPCYKEAYNEIECDVVKKWKTNDLWVSDHPGGYFYGNWASCQDTSETCALPVLENKLVASGPIDRECHHGNLPDFMVKVQNTSHIKAVFEYVKSTGKPLVVRNTGHDWKGRSTGSNSVAIWTHDLRSPHVRPMYDENFKPLNCSHCIPEKVIRIGGGEIWGAAYDFANTNKRAVLGGTCRSVGMAGWLSGGGHSPFTPHLGMGVDNIIQVEVVTPDGNVTIANDHYNRDLFFAVRGGGGGTFGVVTSMTYKTVDIFQPQRFSAKLSNMTGEVLKEFLELATEAAPKWAKQGWGGYIKLGDSLELVKSKGTFDEAKSDMFEMGKFMNDSNISHFFETYNSSYHWQQVVWGAPEKHIGSWSAAVASRLVSEETFRGTNRTELIETLVSLNNAKMNPWLMLVAPTTFDHTEDSALHPSWKKAIWSIRINAKWDQFDSKRDEFQEMFRQVHEAFKPIRDLAPEMGASIAESDIWEENYADVFWGRNYERLQKVKDAIDPKGFMSNWHAVDFKPDQERYKCYPKPTKK